MPNNDWMEKTQLNFYSVNYFYKQQKKHKINQDSIT